jgi:hypothetical protein
MTLEFVVICHGIHSFTKKRTFCLIIIMSLQMVVSNPRVCTYICAAESILDAITFFNINF